MKSDKKKKRGLSDTRNWYRYHFFGTALVTVSKGKKVIEASIANISFSGIGLYVPTPVGKGKRVTVRVSFINKNKKRCEDSITGTVDWQTKFKKIYFLGILFNEELNIVNQPNLLKHLIWLIDSLNLPQPYRDKRISLL